MAQNKQSKKDATNSESTELVNPATNSAAVPAFMAGDAKDGKENIDRSDIILPRLALMQSVSDEVTEARATAGNFWHTILEEELGNVIDDLVIIHHSKQYILWQPRHAGGGILARASDGRTWDEQFRGMKFEVQVDKNRPRHKVTWEISADGAVGKDVGLGAWGTSDPENPDSQPAATLSHVLVCVALSRLDMGPFVVLLQRTSEKTGRQLLTKIDLDQAPIYGQVYRMSSKMESSPNGDFFMPAFAKNGHVGDEAIYRKLQDSHRALAEKGVKYDERGGDDAPASGGGDGGASDPNARY